MAEKDYQNDFFGEEARGKNDRKPHILSRYSQQRFLPYIKIPIEYTVIIAIGVLVLMIISYAVGVERGKRIIVKSAMKVQADTAGASQEGLAEEVTAETDISGDVLPSDEETSLEVSGAFQEIAEEVDPYEGAREEVIENEVYSYESPGYAVQLVSFKSERSANKEVNKLRSQGFEADFDKNDDWYRVYAGGYRTIGEARSARENFLSEYSDCYIRKLK